VQWNITRQFALRASGDYLLSRLEGLTQNNFRVTLGIVFEAGSVKTGASRLPERMKTARPRSPGPLCHP